MSLNHPECIIPPMPKQPKALKKLSNYLIQKKMLGLQHFVRRVSEHETLNLDRHLVVFLTATPKELKKYQKSNKVTKKELGSHKPSTEKAKRDERLERARDYLSELEKMLKILVKRVDINSRALAGNEKKHTRKSDFVYYICLIYLYIYISFYFILLFIIQLVILLMLEIYSQNGLKLKKMALIHKSFVKKCQEH